MKSVVCSLSEAKAEGDPDMEPGMQITSYIPPRTSQALWHRSLTSVLSKAVPFTTSRVEIMVFKENEYEAGNDGNTDRDGGDVRGNIGYVDRVAIVDTSDMVPLFKLSGIVPNMSLFPRSVIATRRTQAHSEGSKYGNKFDEYMIDMHLSHEDRTACDG